MKNAKIILFTLLVIFSAGFIYNAVYGEDGSRDVTVHVAPVINITVPSSVLYGATAHITFTASSNTGYCYASLDGASLAEGWYPYLNPSTPALTDPGTHSVKVLCYINWDWEAPGEATVYFTVLPLLPPTNLQASCNANNNGMTMTWSAPSGFDTFLPRVNDGYGTWAFFDNNYTSTSATFSVTPNVNYALWVHTKAVNGDASDPISMYKTCVRITGGCGSSNGENFYSKPTSGLCDSGSASSVSGLGNPWSWSCYGSGGGGTDYCSANKIVDGGWSGWGSWSSCSLTCGGGNQSQSRTCTNPSPQNGGASCSGSTSQSQSCNEFCCPPTSGTQTIQCSSRNSGWTGTITQTSSKGSYPACAWSSWSDYSDNCSCASPSYQTKTIQCSSRDAGWTGIINQQRDKGSYSTCAWGGWYDTSDTCTLILVLPTVTTKTPVTSITQNTAVGGGNVTSNGGATVDQAGLVWDTSSNPTTSSYDGITYGGWADPGNWTNSITGLNSSTTYHVRAYAINSVGTAYGSDVQFTTSSPSTCSGTPWGNVASGYSKDAYQSSSPSGACVSETRTCTNGTMSGSYTATSCTAGCTGTPWGNVSTGYSDTAYSTSSVTYPSTCTSQTRTCTAGTLSGSYTYTSCSVTSVAPTVTTKTPVTSITQNTASGGGTISSNGGATVTVSGITWSTSSNPTTALSTKTTDGWASGGPWTSTMTGLSSSTTYYVRAYATNSVGTSYGSNVTFTTLPPTLVNGACSSPASHYNCNAGNPVNSVDGSTTWTWTCNGLNGGTNAPCTENKSLPSVTTTTPVTSITQNTAVGGGNVTSNGGSTVTVGGIVWSTSTNPTTALSSKTVNSNWADYSAWTDNITGLSASTTYYVRAYATNSVGTSYGSNVTFTTTASATVPTITTTAASSILQTAATSGGNITSNGGASVTTKGVAWSTTANPTTANSKTSDGTGTGTFTSSITGLTANTTYHIRAYATNSVGTGYGTDLTFTTASSSVINGVCSATHYNCIAGTSGSNVDGASAWTWMCNGSGGGTNASCSESKSGNAIPTVANPTSSAITTTTATINANVTSLGIPASLSARGFCYGTSPSPTSCTALPPAAPSLAIGDSYGGGKVAYILQSGDPGYDSTKQKGLIAATADQTSGIQWYNGSNSTTGATATAIGTGLANTNTIMSAQGETHASYAAGLAREYTGGGYSDWYLPSINELIKVCLNKAAIGGFNPWDYWSSSESNSGNAMEVYFGGDCVTSYVPEAKSYGFQLRPVRSFEIPLGGTTGAFSRNLTGLTQNTLYYFRGYATNATGTGYSPDGTFTTINNGPNLTASAPTPATTGVNVNQQFSSIISNTGGTTTGASFSNFFQVASAANGGGTIINKTSTSMTILAAGGTNTATVSHTFTVAGTYSIRACADKTSSAGGGVITESNENDNCSPSWTNVTVSSSNVPTVANPTSSAITTTTATISANVTSLGIPALLSARGFCYGTSPTPASCTALPPASPLAIGDSYGGGKVAYILQSGDPGYDSTKQKGLIAATADQTSGIQWYNGSNSVTGVTATAIGTGLANSNTIRTSQGTVYTSYAAGLARAYTGGGYSDWYLPSLNELIKICLNQAAVGFPDLGNGRDYWSSSESNSGNAMEVYFGGDCVTSYVPEAKSYGFQLRPVRSFEVSLGGTTGVFSRNLTSLTPNIWYYFRGYATNAAGTGYSPDGTFISTPGTPAVPTVTSPTAVSVLQTTATLGANVTSLGNPAVISARGVCYGTTSNPTLISGATCVTATGLTLGVYTKAVTGLTAGTLYYYAGYATNIFGTGYSPVGTFSSTVVVPTVTTTTPVTSITSTTAVGGGTIVSNGGATITVSGIVWGTALNPTTALGTKTTDGWATGGPWTDSMTGLTPNTLYHVRAYATNTAGTSYGADVTFTSGVIPPTGTIQAVGCNNIPLLGDHCNATLTWNTVNPSGTSTVKTSGGTTVTTGNSNLPGFPSGFPYLIPRGTTTFELWNGGNKINPVPATATATCITGTFWNGTNSCVANVPSEVNMTFTASQYTIFKGRSTTLTWDASTAVSCTITSSNPASVPSTGGAKSNLAPGVVATPTTTTTYTLTCTNGSGSGSISRTIKVIDLTIIEQ